MKINSANNLVRLMQPSDVNEAAKYFAKASMNDPLQTYTFPDEKERREKSPAHFKAVLEFGLKFGEVFTAPDADAVVVWLRPNETNITAEMAEVGGLTKLPALLGEDAAARFLSALDYIAVFHNEEVPEPHWYIMVVGVHPDYSGIGLGRALLEPVMKKAALNSEPIYRETA